MTPMRTVARANNASGTHVSSAGNPGPKPAAADRLSHRRWSPVHQPRSRHSGSLGRSTPSVESSPCPG